MASIGSGSNEWYRVIVACPGELAVADRSRMDRYTRNSLQELNTAVQVTVNNELKYTLVAPSYVSPGNVWDLGFVNACNGEMMLINAMSSTVPQSRLEFCDDYFNFYGFLSGKPKLSAVLGIERKALGDRIRQGRVRTN